MEELIGVNIGESSNIKIYLKEGELDRINMITSPAATLYPPEQLSQEDMFLSGFIWLNEHRPRKMEDVFEWEEVKPNLLLKNTGKPKRR